MARILVDTNIYLQSYADDRIEPLLTVLAKAKADLLVTDQIVDEVHRNRLGVVTKRINESANKSVVVEATLLYLIGDEVAREALRKDIQEVTKKSKEIHARLESRLTDAVQAIADGKDRVSKALEVLFATPIAPTDDQLNRARTRKERGNPPGKRQDPLGDQINWEVFLDSLNEAREVWIVTKDRDFVYERGGRLLLDPLLARELQNRGVDKVHCFNALSDALEHYKAHVASELALPAGEAMVEIRTAEQQVSQAFPFGLTGAAEMNGHFSIPFIPSISTSTSVPLVAPAGVYPYPWPVRTFLHE